VCDKKIGGEKTFQKRKKQKIKKPPFQIRIG
jgi:hypothetical protein